MEIKKKDLNKIFILFLFVHLFIWTLIPSISNNNLPLDTIEALAWGSDLSWGYNKHPPFSAWSTELFYQIFGNQDWAYYFLSQIFVVSAFFIIFKLFTVTLFPPIRPAIREPFHIFPGQVPAPTEPAFLITLFFP